MILLLTNQIIGICLNVQHRVNIKRARGELTDELGRPPTNEEIRNRLGITADRFRDILRTNVRPSSLHEHDRLTGREKVENLVSEEDALSTYARGTSMVLYGLDDVVWTHKAFSLCLLLDCKPTNFSPIYFVGMEHSSWKP